MRVHYYSMSLAALSRLPNSHTRTTDLWMSLVASAGKLANDRKDESVPETRPVGRKVSNWQ